MPLQATSGAASYDAFGGGVAAVPKYIEDYFSTFLYTGNNSTNAINNGIDLSTKGGLIWTKGRSAGLAGVNHWLSDTARGIGYSLASDSTAAQAGPYSFITLGTGGYSLNTTAVGLNTSGETYTSWSWAKAPKFFDVVTYTGTGSAQDIAHSLGSVPACMIIKDTTNAGSAWAIYHTSLGNTQFLQFTTSAAGTSSGYWNNTSPTSTQFTVGTNGNVNQSGATYVAYLFAHNAGGFGLTGTDNVISCGSFTTDGSGNSTVNLGYEPQWLLVKANASGNDWYMYDNMRGLSYSNYVYLSPNLSAAEGNIAADYLVPTATGFNTKSFASSTTYIYIAIRRGPMKVPTDATKVFSPNQTSGTTGTPITTGFPVDWQLLGINDGNVYNQRSSTRLTGVNTNGTSNSQYLVTSNTIAEGATGSLTLNWNNTGFQVPSLNSGSPIITWNFGRAPSFFDEVCYTGTGTYGATNHNLGVTPELVIYKSRSNAVNWGVIKPVSSIAYYDGLLNSNAAFTYYSNDPSVAGLYTSTQFAKYQDTSGYTYVAYLFATCAGVSKVGSYTGTSTTLQVNCGFTGGARFVLIKRTDSTGDWYVWDSARGIVSGNDPYLLMNSSAAEVTSTDYIDTYSAGFEISSTAPAAINASGGTFIFFAVA